LIPIFEDEYEFTVIFEIFFIIIYVIRLIIIKRIEPDYQFYKNIQYKKIGILSLVCFVHISFTFAYSNQILF
jgi:hypothetical protein